MKLICHCKPVRSLYQTAKHDHPYVINAVLLSTSLVKVWIKALSYDYDAQFLAWPASHKKCSNTKRDMKAGDIGSFLDKALVEVALTPNGCLFMELLVTHWKGWLTMWRVRWNEIAVFFHPLSSCSLISQFLLEVLWPYIYGMNYSSTKSRELPPPPASIWASDFKIKIVILTFQETGFVAELEATNADQAFLVGE